jgi:hypothetical protein
LDEDDIADGIRSALDLPGVVMTARRMEMEGRYRDALELYRKDVRFPSNNSIQCTVERSSIVLCSLAFAVGLFSCLILNETQKSDEANDGKRRCLAYLGEWDSIAKFGPTSAMDSLYLVASTECESSCIFSKRPENPELDVCHHKSHSPTDSPTDSHIIPLILSCI